MKKIILLVILIAALVISGFVFNKEINAEESIETPYLEALQLDEAEVSRGVATASMAFYYSDINELINDSDMIFYGKIKSWDSFVNKEMVDMICTEYEFEVTKVLYGDQDIDNITLIEIGGVIPSEEYYSSIDMENYKKDFEPDSVYAEQAKYKWISLSINWTYDVLPLDKDFVIFCKKSTTGENVYYPVGNYQGVFVGEQGGEEFKRIMPQNSIDEIGTLSIGEIVDELSK